MHNKQLHQRNDYNLRTSVAKGNWAEKKAYRAITDYNLYNTKVQIILSAHAPPPPQKLLKKHPSLFLRHALVGSEVHLMSDELATSRFLKAVIHFARCDLSILNHLHLIGTNYLLHPVLLSLLLIMQDTFPAWSTIGEKSTCNICIMGWP